MELNEVFDGWKNLLFSNEEIEAIAKERMKICSVCPHKMKLLKVSVCGICHCPLKAKTRSTETECPLKKWLAVTKENK